MRTEPISDDDERHAPALEEALVAELYTRSRAAFAGLAAVLPLLAWIIGPSLRRDPVVRDIFAALVLLLLARVAVVVVAGRQRGLFASVRARHVAFGIAAIGFSIGLAAFAVRVAPALEAPQLFLLALAYTGIAAIALISMGQSPAIYFGYMLTMLAPVEWLALAGRTRNDGSVFAVMLLLYVAALSAVAIHEYRTRRDNVLLRLRLAEMALVDPLTEVRNRRYLHESMPSEAAAAQRRLGRGRSSERAIGLRETQPSSGGALWFLMVDLDRFKQVNDEHGHDGGDAVLVHVARVLRETVRRQDLVVRWGGEEFVVVARDLGPRDGGAALAERIRAQVAALEIPLPAGGSLRVTCSIGFAPFPFARSTPDALRWQDALTLADLALYHAKHHGRDAAYGLVATRAPAAEAFTAASRDLADAAQRGLVHLFEARHALGPGGLDELDALASSDVVRAAPAESGLVPRLLDDQRTRQSGP